MTLIGINIGRQTNLSCNLSYLQGAVILLLGTKEEVPKEPVERPKFIEDMNESEIATAVCTKCSFAELVHARILRSFLLAAY